MFQGSQAPHICGPWFLHCLLTLCLLYFAQTCQPRLVVKVVTFTHLSLCFLQGPLYSGFLTSPLLGFRQARKRPFCSRRARKRRAPAPRTIPAGPSAQFCAPRPWGAKLGLFGSRLGPRPPGDPQENVARQDLGRGAVLLGM